MNKQNIPYTIALISLGALGMYLGLWWALFPSALILHFILPGVTRTILLSFIAGFLLWLIWAMYLYFTGGQIMTEKISALFGGLPPLLFLASNSVVGGILSVLGSTLGKSFKSLI